MAGSGQALPQTRPSEMSIQEFLICVKTLGLKFHPERGRFDCSTNRPEAQVRRIIGRPEEYEQAKGIQTRT
ncbi:hypothetical protein [Leptospira noguchii]|uniref:hypothetical protein n=1 Tax=Leptospira noguchii TaxID=28182 RepID=UPI001FB5EE3B|nr:hypothetical protein [Leptospira noguchii]UOG36287.1 hypothetical protein MAL02_19220 [Leptospira noguchii]